MSDGIRIVIQGQEATIAALAKRRAAMRRGAVLAMRETVASVAARAKTGFGQPGQVARVSGRLSRSIVGRTTVGTDKVEGRVGSLAVVPYGRRHEFGFSGPEAVRAHTRHITQAFGRPIRKGMTVTVRAFTRRANTPARPFLQPALLNERPEIPTRFRARMMEAIAAASGAGATETGGEG